MKVQSSFKSFRDSCRQYFTNWINLLLNMREKRINRLLAKWLLILSLLNPALYSIFRKKWLHLLFSYMFFIFLAGVNNIWSISILIPPSTQETAITSSHLHVARSLQEASPGKIRPKACLALLDWWWAIVVTLHLASVCPCLGLDFGCKQLLNFTEMFFIWPSTLIVWIAPFTA